MEHATAAGAGTIDSERLSEPEYLSAVLSDRSSYPLEQVVDAICELEGHKRTSAANAMLLCSKTSANFSMSDLDTKSLMALLSATAKR